MEEQLLDWAIELQALAQAGLTYTHDPFDQERFERIRTIATRCCLYTLRSLFQN